MKFLPRMQFWILSFFILWKVIFTLWYVWMETQVLMVPLIFKCVQVENKALRLNSLLEISCDFESLHWSISWGFWNIPDLSAKILMHCALKGFWQSQSCLITLLCSPKNSTKTIYFPIKLHLIVYGRCTIEMILLK